MNWKKNIITLLFSIAFISCDISLFSPQEVYVLPDGYKGAVYIFYEQETGNKSKKENDKVIFKIPKDGVLKIQDQLVIQWKEIPIFYYDK